MGTSSGAGPEGADARASVRHAPALRREAAEVGEQLRAARARADTAEAAAAAARAAAAAAAQRDGERIRGLEVRARLSGAVSAPPGSSRSPALSLADRSLCSSPCVARPSLRARADACAPAPTGAARMERVMPYAPAAAASLGDVSQGRILQGSVLQ